MGIVDWRYVQAPIPRSYFEPSLHSLGGGQHVAMAEGNQVWIGCGSRGVEDKRRGLRINVIGAGGVADLWKIQPQAELVVLRDSRLDDGQAVMHSHASRRRVGAAKHK